MDDQDTDKKSEPPDPSVPGPVYFLVREQAKTVVAVKELEGRIAGLEQNQAEMLLALRELQLAGERKKKHAAETTAADSGLESGSAPGPEGDELLSLLEAIGQKGAVLVAELENRRPLEARVAALEHLYRRDGRVTAVLRESRPAELQRQLLASLTECEVLQARLAQAEQALSSQGNEWLRREAALQLQARRLAHEKEELKIRLEEGKLELTAAQAKSRMLERILASFTQDRDTEARSSAHDDSHNKTALFEELSDIPMKLDADPLEKCVSTTTTSALAKKSPLSSSRSISRSEPESSVDSGEMKSPRLSEAGKELRRMEDRQQRQKWLRQAFQALLASPVQGHEAARLIHKSSDKSPSELQQQLQTILERFPSEEAVV